MIVGIITLLSALSFSLHKHKAKILPLFISVGGTAISVWILKHFLDMPRPETALYLEMSPSFPSGHSALAMALYGFLFLTIWKHPNGAKALPGKEKHPLQNKSLVFLAILILAIGISRLYLGVHFLQDVLAGYLVGLFWIFIANKVRSS